MSSEHYHTRHWPSSMMLKTARDFVDRARKENKTDPFPFLVPSVLLSFAAVEAAVNALIHYALKRNNAHLIVKKYVKEKLKASPSPSIVDKVLYFTYLLTGSSLNPQSSLWERFQKLRKLRNMIIHYKLEELSDQEAQKLAEVVPIKTNEQRKSSAEILREIFYKNLFSREITINTTEKAIKTASEILDKLYYFYYGK